MDKYLPEDVVIRPIVTEKSVQIMSKGWYTFEVDKRASKSKIKSAVEELFNVKVEKVNIVNFKPRPRSLGRYVGKTRSWKKAIVKLKPGQKIEGFEGLIY